jgi:hypothetical protein
MAGPETRYYTSVHRHLPRKLHWEKMHNAYRSGTADVWYSGFAGDLWVEYKYLRELPVNASIRIYELLSPRQLQWLNARHAEGRRVAAVLGSPLGAWIYEDNAWQTLDVNRRLILERGLDHAAIAHYIKGKTYVELHEDPDRHG